MHSWTKLFSEEERGVYEKYQSALRQRVQSFGKRPALLVIDVTLAFIGRRGQSMADTLAEWPTSCGPAAWDAMSYIQQLLDTARQAADVPCIFTTAQPHSEQFYGGTVKIPEGKSVIISRPGAVDIPSEIAPKESELVIQKPKASAFFSTPLLVYLQRRQIDSLIICGATTSGCVRATVVDGFSWGFATFVVEEAVFDRSSLSHQVNLFEMNAKYADVIPMNAALQWLEQCGSIQRVMPSI